ncbi:DNA repair protein RecN [Sphingorhabdus sp. Alg239-R122]|uniref:DNA repair protein RecN n=1 Tax=Sphingorhabdus sp. Alg239-R122 TaxID=2305989 RepID=UPI0013DB3CFC|nr:DNA repair protein RecN [Sphingorhabdus sp. Alg239-R122]
MLQSLAIRNVVLIEALDLDFGQGLGVLTGETGAGKSILLDALGLAMGKRADTALVRAGTDRAVVTASFDTPASGGAIAALLTDNDIDIEPGEPLLVRRQVKADGGSRAFVNDQPVSAALLRELSRLLVEIHGQHDDRGLINPRGHRDMLDSFGGCDLESVKVAWQAWQAAETEYRVAKDAFENANHDRELLIHNIQELRDFAPEEGEEERLALERATMQKGERLTEDLADIAKVWDGSKSPLAQLRVAARKLDRIAADHPLLGEALGALDRAVIEASEAEDKLNSAAEALHFDPEYLDGLERRLFDLRALARKHDCTGIELPNKLAEWEAELENIDTSGNRLGGLKKAADAAQQAYRKAAEKLHKQRVTAGKRLDKAVADELAPLKLDAAKFQTSVEALPDDKAGPGGSDHVEFLISTNPGADFAPLMKIASGGELSRFILALKVALAEQGGAETMIFDEIDRGVGGAVASAIGDRLARLSENGQTLVVTHSPQVAARGSRHYFITKSSEGTVTRTDVTALDEAARRQEIARMLSGAEVTPEARAQADRLLEGV